MSMVLEAPSLAAVKPEHASVLKHVRQTAYDSMLAILQAQYVIADENRVLTYLRQHSHLIPILQEGRAVVTVFFGEDATVRLRVRRDPETGHEYLLAWVQSALSPEEAVERWMEFGVAWDSERSQTSGDDLQFALG